jgi:hypothetical protein
MKASMAAEFEVWQDPILPKIDRMGIHFHNSHF